MVKKKTTKKAVKKVVKKPVVKKPVVAKKIVAKKIVAEKVKAIPSAKTTKKKSLVEKYQTHKDDTGSSEVQIALLSEKIDELVKHLRKHYKDQDSKRGLLVAINKRRRLLNYLQRTNIKKYQKIIADLGLRK